MYNVTLRGGITSGKFRDRGVLPNMQECLRICCIAKSCDLAFMLSDHCFSVTCKNQTLCEVVTARSNGYKPEIAYIYARSNMASHESSQPDTQDQDSKSLPISVKDHPKLTSSKNIHNHTQHSGHKHKKAKNQSVYQISRSKYKKKAYKTKKPRRRKKRRKKAHQSNQEKLKRIYAKERILLRKLSLLKLRMEMIKRKNHGGDKNTKDNVLSEAFEYEPEDSKTSSFHKKNISSRSQTGDKIERADGNITLNSKYSTKTLMEKNSSRNSTNRTEKPTKVRKPLKTDNRMNESAYTTKQHKESFSERGSQKINVSQEKQNVFQNNTLSKERSGTLQKESGNTTNVLSTVHESGSSSLSKIEKNSFPLVKDTGVVINSGNLTNFKLLNFQNMVSQANLEEQGNVQKVEKQSKIRTENGIKSFGRTKVSSGGKEDSKNTASLEEMISQTTESKARESDKTQHKNEGRIKNRTFSTKERIVNNIGNLNSLKDIANNSVNIAPNTSVSSTQSKESTETKTIPKNNSLSRDKLVTRSQNTLYPEERTKDLMLLSTFSSETKEKDDSQGTVNPLEDRSSLRINSSQTVPKRR